MYIVEYKKVEFQVADYRILAVCIQWKSFVNS